MEIDPSRLFAIEAAAENARAAFLAASARRDRVQGWLDAQRRARVSDQKARPGAIPPSLTGLTPESRAQAFAAVSDDAALSAEAASATAAGRAAGVARLEADLAAASADLERAAQAQAQMAALAEACRKFAEGQRHV